MKNISESRERLLLLIIIAIAAFLRVWKTDQYSIFGDYDEYYTAMTAKGIYESKLNGGPFFELNELTSSSFTERLQDANRDNGNSFFYNYVLSIATSPFGHSEMSMRIFSSVFDLFSILIIWLIGKRLVIAAPRRLLACSLYAVFPVMVNYAGIIRTYAFTTFFCLLLLLLLLNLNPEKWSFKKSLAIALTATAIFLGHFLTYYLLVVAFIFFLFSLKKEKYSSITALSGLGFAAVLCGAFLLFNLNQLTNFSDNSKRYEGLAGKSVQEGNMRKLEPVTLPNLSTKSILYFDQFYTGNTYAMKWVQALAGDSMMYIAGILLLCIPILLFFFLEKNSSDSPTIRLWVWMIIAGHAGALLLVFLSGHMISLGIKYTMFTIPCYLMLTAFYTKRNLLTRGAFALLLFGSLFTCIGSFSNKGNKAVKIVFNGQEKDYLSKEKADFMSQVGHIISENPDTIFVNTIAELVFIEMSGLRTTQHTGYVAELDPTAQYEERSLPFHFEIPD